MTLSFTQFFRFGIPDFVSSPWHSEFEQLVREIDRVLYEVAIVEGALYWTNSTVYAPGNFVIDGVTGFIYVNLIGHTSAVSPTTFASDRVAHPTFWAQLAPPAVSGGAVQLVTAAGTVFVSTIIDKVIINKAAPSVTPVQLPLIALYTFSELLISDFAGNGGDITITPGLGERIGGLTANTPYVVGSGGAGLGGSIRLSKIDGIGWAIG